MPLELIIAGLPRTGTTSMCKALKELGYKNTMHMDACIANPKLMAAWQKIYANHLERTWTTNDWRNFFDNEFPGYDSGIDCPFADFVVEIAKAYPDAKVILQYRDGKQWFNSFQGLIQRASFSWFQSLFIMPLPGVYALHRLMKDRLRWWHDVYNYPESGEHIMSQYVAKIQNAIPEKQLLLYNVKQGWDPLCIFLNKPLPWQEFPRLNDEQSSAKVHQDWIHEGRNIWIKWFIVGFVCIIALIVIVCHY